MKLCILILVSVFLFASCEKSSPNTIPFNSTYYPVRIDSIQSFRAFTSTGEILDPNVITRLIRNNAWAFSDSSMKKDIAPIDSIYFALSNIGQVHYHRPSIGTDFDFIMTRSGNDLILTSTLAGNWEIDTSSLMKIDSMELFYPFLLYNPVYTGTGSYIFSFKDRVYLTESSPGIFKMPCFVSLLIVSRTEYGDFSFPYNNRFNPEFPYQSLPPGDTLEIREISFVFQRK